jgi:hypothetical protein
MTPAHGLILIAILLAAIQAEARHGTSIAAEDVVPVHWLSENFHGSRCTGIDLNAGCVPVELTTAQLF